MKIVFHVVINAHWLPICKAYFGDALLHPMSFKGREGGFQRRRQGARGLVGGGQYVVWGVVWRRGGSERAMATWTAREAWGLGGGAFVGVRRAVCIKD
jgi:hypothetical protein